MLHSALLSIWTFHVKDIVLNQLEDAQELGLQGLSRFIHPADKEILKGITKITSHYHSVEEFCILTKNLSKLVKNNDDRAVKAGLYLNSFCDGLNECLKDYRESVVKLEREILENPNLNLTYIKAHVEKYLNLFYALKSMIRMVKVEEIYGCLLVGKIFTYVKVGISDVSKAGEMIYYRLTTRFYRQLASWIIYGDIIDTNGEFFIKDCKCNDENFLYLDQGEDAEETISMKISTIRKQFCIRKFELVPKMIPLYLSKTTAQTILFIGRVVWILRNDPQKKYLKARQDVWDGKHVEYYKKIQDLETLEADSPIIHEVIEECRIKLTKYLWHVMVEDANLLEHLQMIRDYYCLGRGELFQEFLILSKECFQSSKKRSLNNKYLNVIFKDTSSRLYPESDSTYRKFEINLPKDSESIYDMELYFELTWPLHVIFHPKVMSLYNKMLSFLLRIKMIHIDLHRLWLTHIKNKNIDNRGIWKFRHNLMFLINNIEYYLHVDVIESDFAMLKESIKDVNEFNDIIRLHSTFLNNMLSKTFMISVKDVEEEQHYSLYQVPSLDIRENNTIYKIIDTLLDLCEKFCHRAIILELEPEELDSMERKCKAIVEELMRKLHSIHRKVKGHHFLQLINRLDFNRWYKNKSDLNATVNHI